MWYKWWKWFLSGIVVCFCVKTPFPLSCVCVCFSKKKKKRKKRRYSLAKYLWLGHILIYIYISLSLSLSLSLSHAHTFQSLQISWLGMYMGQLMTQTMVEWSIAQWWWTFIICVLALLCYRRGSFVVVFGVALSAKENSIAQPQW